MKEAQGGEGLNLERSKGDFISAFISQAPPAASTTRGGAGGIEVPSQGFTTSALSRGSATHQDIGCVQERRGERPSNHPQPKAAYPNKGRHIPFCLSIKSWLLNQTSGSYTSLSFEGKALFPRIPPASCGPFSSSSNTTNYTTFVCYELTLPLPGQELDSDCLHKCLIMGHKPNKSSPSLNISCGEEKITVK